MTKQKKSFITATKQKRESKTGVNVSTLSCNRTYLKFEKKSNIAKYSKKGRERSL